jgi:branched-chain amino acid transport system substrate-binding protein
MTRQEASEGQDMENAIKLAIANLNAKGGVLGKTITTVSADDAL